MVSMLCAGTANCARAGLKGKAAFQHCVETFGRARGPRGSAVAMRTRSSECGTKRIRPSLPLGADNSTRSLRGLERYASATECRVWLYAEPTLPVRVRDRIVIRATHGAFARTVGPVHNAYAPTANACAIHIFHGWRDLTRFPWRGV